MPTVIFIGRAGNRMEVDAPAGFSLLELMVTVAVAAVVLGLAAPNFRSFIQNNRLRAATLSDERPRKVRGGGDNRSAPLPRSPRIRIESVGAVPLAICFGIIVTGVYLVGLIIRRKPRVGALGIDSVIVLVVFAGSLLAYYHAR